MTYRPPFITEVDEPAWDDCQICSGLMLAATWTNGAIVERPDGQPMDTDELKKLRERVRDTLGPGRQAGGLSLDDLDEALRNVWPELKPLPRWTSGLNLGFDEVWDKLVSGEFVAVMNGNPARVTNPASNLRKWTNNDDFGHAIYVHAASEKAAFVMDPLGRAGYEGNWVPRTELEQFLSAYGTETDRAVAVVRKGAAERLVRGAKGEVEPAKTPDTCAVELTAAKRRITRLVAEAEALNAANTTLRRRVQSIGRALAGVGLDSTQTPEERVVALRDRAVNAEAQRDELLRLIATAKKTLDKA